MYIGIDPGKKGGICILSKDGGIALLERLGDDYRLAEILCRAAEGMDRRNSMAYVEKVGAMPGNGVASMFRFGEGFGVIQGLLIGYKIPFQLVTPYSWQKSMHGGINKKNAPDPKLRSLAAARQLYPDAKIVPEGCRIPNDGLIDALLIAAYGRRTELERSFVEKS